MSRPSAETVSWFAQRFRMINKMMGMDSSEEEDDEDADVVAEGVEKVSLKDEAAPKEKSREKPKEKFKDPKEEEEDMEDLVKILGMSGNTFFSDTRYLCTGIQLDVPTKLAMMKQEQVEEVRQKLLKSVKPEHLEFLKHRGKFTPWANPDLVPSLNNDTFYDPESPSEPIPFEPLKMSESLFVDPELLGDGVHMNVVEKEKLAWMQNAPQVHIPPSGTFYNARFDFNGDLQPFVEKESYDSKLYHHGEEPQRPGYTFEELFQLTRSSVLQQRVTALNTIAAILEKEYIYSECFQRPMIKELLEANIFLILRFSMDDSCKSVYMAALRAMAALLWSPVDEEFLIQMADTLGDFQYPSLGVYDSAFTPKNLKEMKDVDIVKLDVIRGAMRTDFLPRIRYILEDTSIKPPEVALAMRCLLRFCYHSHEAAFAVTNTPKLLRVMYTMLSHPDFRFTIHVSKILLVFAALCKRGKEFAQLFVERYNVLPYIFEKLSQFHIRTSTGAHCVKLWSSILMQEVGQGSVKEFSPALYGMYNWMEIILHSQNNTGVLNYANALISLLGLLIKTNYEQVRFLIPLMDTYTGDWANIMLEEEGLNKEFIKLLANVLYVFPACSNEDTYYLYFHPIVKKLIEKRALNFFKSLRPYSFLLNAKRDFPPNLPTLCVPLKMLAGNNEILMLHVIVKHCLKYGDVSGYCKHICAHPSLWHYIKAVASSPNLRDNAGLWGARFEVKFLSDTAKLLAKRSPDCIPKKTVLELGFTAISIVHAGDEETVADLMRTVIFATNLYEGLVGQEATTQMPEFFKYYLSYLESLGAARKKGTRGKNLASEALSEGNILDFVLTEDWMYAPLRECDANCLDVPLRWLCMLEGGLGSVLNKFSPTRRFCELARVFLKWDDHVQDLAPHLAAILEQMLRRGMEFDLEERVTSHGTFYEFYRALCEQFSSVSYGNEKYALFLLVALQRKYNVKYRKLLWMEMTSIMRWMGVKVADSPIPLQNFLEPCETDPQLLDAYLYSTSTGYLREDCSPILFRMAVHHVATFIKLHKEKPDAAKLFAKVDKLGNTEIRQEILNYYGDCGSHCVLTRSKQDIKEQ